MFLALRYLVLFILFVSPLAYSSNYAVIVGGAETPFEKPIFQKTFNSLSLFGDRAKDWNTRILYERTPAKLGSKDFTSKNFKKHLDKLRKQISYGEIGKGDQLMIYIDTHGSPKKSGQETHSVGTQTEDFDLDYLKSIRDLAEEKGVKLAVVDQSCHSGALINLGSDKTCVISAASKTSSGYGDIGESFAMDLTETPYFPTKRSLEDLFLKTRANSLSPGQPMISTEPGRKAALAIESFNNMYYADKLNNQQSCQGSNLDLRNQALNTQLALLKQLVKDPDVYQRASKQMSDALSLKFNLIKKGEKLSESLGSFMLCGGGVIKSPADISKNDYCLESESLSGAKDLLKMKTAKLEMLKKNLKEMEDEEESNSGTGTLRGTFVDTDIDEGPPDTPESLQTQITALKSMINSKVYKKYFQEAPDRKRKVDLYTQTINDLSAKERELYSTLYNYFKSESKESNPCADFKL